MNIKVNICNTTKSKFIPKKQKFEFWLKEISIPNINRRKYEVVINIVGPKAITRLNKLYRKKDKPTNIISFDFCAPPQIKTNFLGDLVICASIVKAEAKTQNKSLISHWAHLTIHGALHLLGYDHKNPKEAKKMENLEIETMKNLGFSNPYEFS